MNNILKVSEAAGLAIHAITVLARLKQDKPMKVESMAKKLKASENHLGKVMHRLAQARVVQSRRGPQGGFVLGPRAKNMTLLELYEMFDGPLEGPSCLLGFEACPFGSCILGDAILTSTRSLKESLSRRRIADL